MQPGRGLGNLQSLMLLTRRLLQLWPDGSVRYKHSKADFLWEKAWSRGHAMGLNEVWIELKDLKELLSEVFPSQT